MITYAYNTFQGISYFHAPSGIQTWDLRDHLLHDFAIPVSKTTQPPRLDQKNENDLKTKHKLTII